MSRKSSKQSSAEKARKREIMEVLIGLMMAFFVSNLSVTIVGNSLPQTMAALNGSETQYTWIITGVLLASTAVTPIAGRLGDLFDKKKLLLAAIAIFTIGSLLSGLVTDATQLIATRVLQGIGMGAQMALVQTVMASIITPRERGRYNGYIGATMAVSTVSGPLIGGLIVATPWLGWRWTFWVGIPFSLIAMVVLWKYLHLPPTTKTKPKVDYWGSILITSAVSMLLIWLSTGGELFPWVSPLGIGLPIAAVVTVGLFVWVELNHPEPVVPLRLLRQRTPLFAVLASIGIGTALNAPAVFFGQYFQIARGMNPAMAGLVTLPLMLGMLLSSTISGQFVSRIGRWKRFVVTGMVLMTTGLAMMSFAGSDTSMWYLWIGMALIGIGQGSSMQNLVLAVQNGVPLSDIGASTAMVTFFRTLGGAIGVQIAGMIYKVSTEDNILEGVQAAGLSSKDIPGTESLNLQAMSPQMADIVRSAYGDAMGDIFMAITIMGLFSLICAILLPGSSLRDTLDLSKGNESLQSGDSSTVEQIARKHSSEADEVAASELELAQFVPEPVEAIQSDDAAESENGPTASNVDDKHE